MPIDYSLFARRTGAAALATALLLGTAACSTSDDATSTTSNGSAAVTIADGSLFDSSVVNTIAIEVDQDEYDAAIATYLDSGDKEWITATVTIDGETFENVGLRLKGNSSLRDLTAEAAENPEDLPWLVRLDKYEDDQSLDGVTSFVIRSNTTETALNEAVALELIGLSGLATEEATATRISVNGGEESLRLVIENPDDAWLDSEFADDGILYKAESTGDYTYRGDDAELYDDVFDVEAGEEDYAPLTEFLQFINESDDETFSAELADHLDVDAFATYLAMQTLVDNFDDIDGPGNNSYLFYDDETGQMTVVAWDQNLSFGVRNEGEGGGIGQAAGGAPGVGELPANGELPAAGDLPADGELPADGQLPTDGQLPADGAAGARPARPADGQLPTDGQLPADGQLPTDGQLPADGELPADTAAGAGALAAGRGGAGAQGSNILSERFLADETFSALVTERLAELTTELATSGTADEVLTTWTSVLTEQASDLVSTETIDTESASISAYFD